MLLEDNLIGFHHIGIPVFDLEKTKKWYINHLGFDVINETDMDNKDGLTECCFIQHEDTLLKLYQPENESLKEVKNRSVGHIDHFIFDVLDIEKAVNTLTRNGVEYFPATPDGPVKVQALGEQGEIYVFLKTYNGEKLGLNQKLGLDKSRRENNLNGLSHVGIRVNDITPSENFYKQFGFTEFLKDLVPLGDVEIELSTWSFGDFNLELVKFHGADPQEVLSRDDGLIDHIAFQVKDINRAFDSIRSSGISFLENEPIELNIFENGIKYFTVRGPTLEKIQFIQLL